MTAKSLTREGIAVTKRARMMGYFNHIIAAYYRINQGRIAEVNTGKMGADVPPADCLPPDFPKLA